MASKIRIQYRFSSKTIQKTKIALASAMGGFAIFAFVMFLTYDNVGSVKVAVAAPGKNGAKTVSTANVILNEFTSLTSDASSGASHVDVANAYLNSNGRFSKNISAGDLVMIIQMQDACITTTNNSTWGSVSPCNNAGNFEFAEVNSTPSATRINLVSNLSKSYTASGKVQVIRVPRYSSLTITPIGSVITQAWNGTTGGVLAVEVNGATVINGIIDVSGLGFIGDTVQNNSISGNGNIFMGNGGSTGDSNDNPGTTGGNGGGIVYLISYGAVSGTGSVNANGFNAGNSTSASSNQNVDSSESGGGGGSVYIYTRGSAISNLSINAKGGKGSTQSIPGIQEAEGGVGGDGGYICITNNNSLVMNVSGGRYGTTDNGANSGAAGTIALSPLNPYSSGVSLPVELVSFNGVIKDSNVKLIWATSAEINNDYFTIEKSINGITFTPCGKIEGAGNTTIVQEYGFDDMHPSEGINHYRLMQTDFSGKTEYFKIISVNFQSKIAGQFEINEVRPNPFKENFTIDFNSDDEANCEMQLIDKNGKIITGEKFTAYAGINSYRFESKQNLTKGIYYIRLLKADVTTKSIKLLKE